MRQRTGSELDSLVRAERAEGRSCADRQERGSGQFTAVCHALLHAGCTAESRRRLGDVRCLATRRGPQAAPGVAPSPAQPAAHGAAGSVDPITRVSSRNETSGRVDGSCARGNPATRPGRRSCTSRPPVAARPGLQRRRRAGWAPAGVVRRAWLRRVYVRTHLTALRRRGRRCHGRGLRPGPARDPGLVAAGHTHLPPPPCSASASPGLACCTAARLHPPLRAATERRRPAWPAASSRCATSSSPRRQQTSSRPSATCSAHRPKAAVGAAPGRASAPLYVGVAPQGVDGAAWDNLAWIGEWDFDLAKRPLPGAALVCRRGPHGAAGVRPVAQLGLLDAALSVRPAEGHFGPYVQPGRGARRPNRVGDAVSACGQAHGDVPLRALVRDSAPGKGVSCNSADSAGRRSGQVRAEHHGELCPTTTGGPNTREPRAQKPYPAHRLLAESRVRTGACARLGPGVLPVALSSAAHDPSCGSVMILAGRVPRC
jgi:hypothetical protein